MSNERQCSSAQNSATFQSNNHHTGGIVTTASQLICSGTSSIFQRQHSMKHSASATSAYTTAISSTNSTTNATKSPLPPPRRNNKLSMKTSSASTTDKGGGGHGSDSENSNQDSNSMSGGESDHPKDLVQFRESSRKKISRRKGSEWEIIEGLKDGQRFENKPEKFAGYLHKKRKWPLKGWHKRYFIVDKGILTYAKSPTDITRGKLHGSVDIALSVISTKEKRRRLDIDAEEFIYHLKAKTPDIFNEWVQQLKVHRLYRQHLLTYGTTKDLQGNGIRRSTAATTVVGMLVDDVDTTATLTRNKLSLASPTELLPVDPGIGGNQVGGDSRNSLQRGLKASIIGTLPACRLSSYLVESGPVLENTGKELLKIQQNIEQLAILIENLENSTQSQSSHHVSNSSVDIESINLESNCSPNVKKDRKKFGLRKKKSSKGSSVDLTSTFNPNPDNASPLSTSSFSPSITSQNNQLSSSQTSLNQLSAPNQISRPQSLPAYQNAEIYPHPHLASAPSTAALSQALIYNEKLSTSNIATMAGQINTCDHNVLMSFKDDLIHLARETIRDLKKVYESINIERDRLKTVIDTEMSINNSNNSVVMSPTGNTPSTNIMLSTLRSSLQQALQQNSELRSRLANIHELSDTSEISSVPNSEQVGRPFNASLSYSSSCVSASEFFDAEDLPLCHLSPGHQHDPDNNVNSDEISREIGDARDLQVVAQAEGSETSSEGGSLSSGEDGGSVSSENSEMGHEFSSAVESNNQIENLNHAITGRRTKLPVPRPNTEGLSLWNLLTKNIGKDLSQVSMPVTLNEPLNMLQRLCEELEYSELLDKAAELSDPYERMVYVAAFAVSSYGNSHYRAGNKPFNPLLGETYECIREDKGFKFISEQVSHHPPVSSCHAESKNYIFWQDARIKTKFWGKSMEFQPLGLANVKLLKYGEHYQYNKVTTCVHNLFSGQRWVDQYGELKITNLTSNIVCKLTFVKASYWSAKRHEVHGTIINEDGKVVRKLFGKWSEALYCGVVPSAKCIWRLGTMPEDYELYYGFTRFAIELNELGPEAPVLPCTDTRLRPDQRALEEGNIDLAEKLKLDLEQAQRERRKQYESQGIEYEPRWFLKKYLGKDECWEYSGKYWELRKNPGFKNLNISPLW